VFNSTPVKYAGPLAQPVRQVRTKWQRQPAGDILHSWTRMTVVQQLTCLTSGCPNGPAYSTAAELLNTLQVSKHFPKVKALMNAVQFLQVECPSCHTTNSIKAI